VLVAMDPSRRALASAAEQVPTNTELLLGAVPEDWPEGVFDLVVISEVAYYLDAADLDRLVARLAASLDPMGHVVAVHWREKVPDYPADAAQVHRRLLEAFPGLGHYEDGLVVIDVLGGPAGRICPP